MATRERNVFDLDEWKTRGFAVARRPLIASELGPLRSEFRRLIRDIDQLPRPPVRYGVEDTAVQDNLEMLSHPHWSSDVVKALAHRADLGRLAAELLRARRVRLWGTAFICKYAGAFSRNQVSWHRDMTFWQCLSAPRLLTFWMALGPVSTANGGMEFAVGSHLVPPTIGDDSDLPGYRIQPLIGPAGTVSVHHCLTGHRSGPNRSDTDRIALTLHYMDAELRYVPGTASDDHMNVPLIAFRNNNALDEAYFPVVFDNG